MPTDPTRLRIIQEIQAKRKGSKVLVYFTGDRPGRETQIAEDIIPIIHDHLQRFGNVKDLDLFIYTRGGIIFAPWRLVTLAREFTGHLSVLVPFRCHSAGTLIALGANEIVMTNMGELSPVDPQFVNPGGGVNPAGDRRSVEDVISYIAFAKKVGIKGQEQLGAVFGKLLSERLTALDIGSIHRGYNLIRYLVRQLLSTHMAEKKYNVRIKEISDFMTEKLHAHEYKIGRKEAKSIGLTVVFPIKDVEKLMWELYCEYEKLMELRDPWVPEKALAGQQNLEFQQVRAAIESEKLSHHFVSEVSLSTSPRPAQLNIQNLPPNIPKEVIEQLAQQIIRQISPQQVAVKTNFEGWREV